MQNPKTSVAVPHPATTTTPTTTPESDSHSSAIHYLLNLPAASLLQLVSLLPQNIQQEALHYNFYSVTSPISSSSPPLSSLSPSSSLSRDDEDLDEYFLSRPSSYRVSLLHSLPQSLYISMKASIKSRQRWRKCPSDLLFECFYRYLSSSDLLKLRSVSPHWSKCSQYERVWRGKLWHFDQIIPSLDCKNYLQKSLKFLRHAVITEGVATDHLCKSLSSIKELKIISFLGCLNADPLVFKFFSEASQRGDNKVESLELYGEKRSKNVFLPHEAMDEIANIKNLKFLGLHFQDTSQIEHFESFNKKNNNNNNTIVKEEGKEKKEEGKVLSSSDVTLSMRGLVLDTSQHGEISSLLSSFSHCSQLEILNLRYNHLHDGHLRTVGQFPSLLALDIQQEDFTQLTSPGLSSLLHCKKIKYLNMAHRECITDEMMETLSQLTQIIVLNLNGCYGFTAKGMEKMVSLKKIQYLGVSMCNVNDKLLGEWANSMRKLVAIQLDGCTNVTEKGVQNFLTLIQQNPRRINGNSYLKSLVLPDHLHSMSRTKGDPRLLLHVDSNFSILQMPTKISEIQQLWKNLKGIDEKMNQIKSPKNDNILQHISKTPSLPIPSWQHADSQNVKKENESEAEENRCPSPTSAVSSSSSPSFQPTRNPFYDVNDDEDFSDWSLDE